MPLARRLAGVALVVAGIFVALFFLALLGIADCSERCQRDGERAPAIALVAAGVALAIVGGLLLRGRGWRAAVATPLAGAGAAAVAIAGWYAIAGAGLSSSVVGTGVPGLAALGLGLWLARG